MPMVTTDIDQFTDECNTWREALRSQREEFSRMKNQLQNAAAHITSKEALKAVDHYENQFDIQLSNIHDLKQSIKTHNKTFAYQLAEGDGPPETNADHEKISADYYDLKRTLHELKTDFQRFLINYS
jgi:DNA-binding helix-hairpin-helix protein with protein kinase domain